jgi:hypothetical protein
MYAHLVLKKQKPAFGLVHGIVQDAFTSEVCGGWIVSDGEVHIYMDSTVDWWHQLAEYRLVLTRGGEQYWQLHEDELADKLLFIAQNEVMTVEESLEEVEERYGLADIPDIYVKFERVRGTIEIPAFPKCKPQCTALVVV